MQIATLHSLLRSANAPRQVHPIFLNFADAKKMKNTPTEVVMYYDFYAVILSKARLALANGTDMWSYHTVVKHFNLTK